MATWGANGGLQWTQGDEMGGEYAEYTRGPGWREFAERFLRSCRHVELHRAKNGLDRRWRMGGSDPRGDNPVHIGRHGSGRQAGSQPADNHDDAAVHGGNVRSRHWRGNGHRVVAEPPAGCQRERLKW